MNTLYPRLFRSNAKDALVMPFPRELTTPPVMKTYFVGFFVWFFIKWLNR